MRCLQSRKIFYSEYGSNELFDIQPDFMHFYLEPSLPEVRRPYFLVTAQDCGLSLLRQTLNEG